MIKFLSRTTAAARTRLDREPPPRPTTEEIQRLAGNPPPPLDADRAKVWVESEKVIADKHLELRRRQDAAVAALQEKKAKEDTERAARLAADAADREKRRRERRALPLPLRVGQIVRGIGRISLGLACFAAAAATLGVFGILLSLLDPVEAYSMLGGTGLAIWAVLTAALLGGIATWTLRQRHHERREEERKRRAWEAMSEAQRDAEFAKWARQIARLGELQE